MVKRVGQYELKNILGKGTFGTVYLGKHVPSKNKIAVKVIQKESLKPELLLRLEQEIQCQRSVSSENIVKLIDVQKTENNFYLILEYCPGGDLGKFLKDNGPVNESIAQRWIQQIVEGFKVLQKKNIIHRDLKTQNILLTEKNTSAILKLADFGLSRFIEDDLAKTWVGTPLYMAPEIFNCEEYGAKADIWSLGLVLYEMLTGELPIKVQRREQIPAAQKSLKACPLGLSDDCKDLLSKLLEYDPKNRISFQDLFLHPFITGKKVILEPNIDEYQEIDEFEEDFVLLERDESIHEMLIMKKDTHPLINVPEIIASIQSDIEICITFDKIAEKLKMNNNSLIILAIYIEAISILENQIKLCKDIIAKYQLGEALYPEFFEKFNSLKLYFKDFAKKSDETNRYLQVGNFNRSESYNILEFIKKYAVDLCKNGANDEYLTDYGASKLKYQEALTLLNYLNKSKHTQDSPSKKYFDNFLADTYKRLKKANIRVMLYS